MSDVVFWLASHVDTWKPLAESVLGAIFIAAVYWVVTAWEQTR